MGTAVAATAAAGGARAGAEAAAGVAVVIHPENIPPTRLPTGSSSAAASDAMAENTLKMADVYQNIKGDTHYVHNGVQQTTLELVVPTPYVDNRR